MQDEESRGIVDEPLNNVFQQTNLQRKIWAEELSRIGIDLRSPRTIIFLISLLFTVGSIAKCAQDSNPGTLLYATNTNHALSQKIQPLSIAGFLSGENFQSMDIVPLLVIEQELSGNNLQKFIQSQVVKNLALSIYNNNKHNVLLTVDCWNDNGQRDGFVLMGDDFSLTSNDTGPDSPMGWFDRYSKACNIDGHVQIGINYYEETGKRYALLIQQDIDKGSPDRLSADFTVSQGNTSQLFLRYEWLISTNQNYVGVVSHPDGDPEFPEEMNEALMIFINGISN